MAPASSSSAASITILPAFARTPRWIFIRFGYPSTSRTPGIRPTFPSDIVAWLGASASEVYPPDISRASLVISIVQRLLGRPGLVLFSVVVALACITTAVGLVSSTADHFATISRRKLGYRLCVIVICVFSAFVSNLGLDTIISVAAPILGLVYPPVLVLLAVSLLMPHISNSICISAVLGALAMSVLSTADSLGLPMPWLHRMPLANVDMACPPIRSLRRRRVSVPPAVAGACGRLNGSSSDVPPDSRLSIGPGAEI